jgi:myo-inositol-1(or 4)-monophosphatase
VDIYWRIPLSIFGALATALALAGMVRRWRDALIGSGFGYDAVRRRRQALRLSGVFPHVRDRRRGGSAALDMAWVAAGRLDGYYEFGVNAWDVAAGAVIVIAAGGEVQQLPVGPEGAPGTLAARPGLAAQLRAVVDAAADGIN